MITLCDFLNFPQKFDETAQLTFCEFYFFLQFCMQGYNVKLVCLVLATAMLNL